jgi:hypothetical protein
MRSLVFTLIILAINYTTVFSQKVKFNDTANLWSVSNLGLSPSDPFYNEIKLYRVLKDSFLNGNIYQQFSFGLVREDSQTHQIFVKFNSNFLAGVLDTIEKVLYDYTLQIGDSVEYQYAYDTFKHKVVNIDSVQINGIFHRVWHLEDMRAYTDYCVIEGIGSTKGPWFPAYPYEFENMFWLTCFWLGPLKATINPAVPLEPNSGYYFNNTTSCALSVKNIAHDSKEAIVVPNPVLNKSSIIFPHIIRNGRITIHDINGRQIWDNMLRNEKEAMLPEIIYSGVYIYRIFDLDRAINYSGQFLVN